MMLHIQGLLHAGQVVGRLVLARLVHVPPLHVLLLVEKVLGAHAILSCFRYTYVYCLCLLLSLYVFDVCCL